jgi:GAF domain-containing protein
MVKRPDCQIAGLLAVSRFYVGDATLEETLQRVADVVNATISTSDMVGVTLLSERGQRTMRFTHGAAANLDRAQYRSGIGPAVDAFCYRSVRRSDSIERDRRWPTFTEAAAAAGISSTLSFPMVSHDDSIGVLNCYSRTAFSAEDEQLGAEFATTAAVALANAQAYWEARHLSERLRIAAKSRPTIEQAKGILIAAQRCGPDQAFEILVGASQRENRKLRDIAQRIVRSTIAGSAAPSGAGGGRTLA